MYFLSLLSAQLATNLAETCPHSSSTFTATMSLFLLMKPLRWLYDAVLRAHLNRVTDSDQGKLQIWAEELFPINFIILTERW